MDLFMLTWVLAALGKTLVSALLGDFLRGFLLGGEMHRITVVLVESCCPLVPSVNLEQP